jgi:DNA-binding response OmpR family regulator
MSQPPLLLVGDSALRLVERLVASGYSVCGWDLDQAHHALAQTADQSPRVQAVLLSAAAMELTEPLLQRFQINQGVPLLLEVAEDDLESRCLCLQSGANDFWLAKAPPSDLLKRLRLVLQNQANIQEQQLGQNQQLLRQGDLRLDPRQRRAWRGARELQLTAREYALLVLLLEHNGEAVSREAILEQVWGQLEEQGNGNVIEVYVRYLRRKLEQGGERRLIHTVRGIGYCLRSGEP